MTNDQLYMTAAEQKSAIESAGYMSVVQLLLKGGMVLHRAAVQTDLKTETPSSPETLQPMAQRDFEPSQRP